MNTTIVYADGQSALYAHESYTSNVTAGEVVEDPAEYAPLIMLSSTMSDVDNIPTVDNGTDEEDSYIPADSYEESDVSAEGPELDTREGKQDSEEDCNSPIIEN